MSRSSTRSVKCTVLSGMLIVIKSDRTSWISLSGRCVDMLLASFFLFKFDEFFQNIAEIDEIPSVEKIETIDLPAAERAIYLELEPHLRALDMTIKRGRKTESDREKRLAKALGDSK